ncbi:hypothetical protein BC629DRAFT_398241 [Irpex lacteus]|nr:hypothetical protein BC629DRAFT_398241 [Irpex lacteus]
MMLSKHSDDSKLLVEVMADGYFVADQKVYTPAIPPTDGFTPVDAITFKHNGKPGVPIKVALDSCKSCGKDCTGLEGGGATAPIVAKGDKVSLRLEWLGCQSWSTPVNVTSTHQGQTQICTKAKLAREVAKAIKTFYGTKKYCKSESWTEAKAQEMTPEDIPFDCIVFLELRHVSKGSYQPVLLYPIPGLFNAY